MSTRRISANIAKLRELLKAAAPPFKGIALSRKPPVEKWPRRGVEKPPGPVHQRHRSWATGHPWTHNEDGPRRAVSSA